MRLVFMGPPGAGKGTQAKSVAAACGVPHVSSGDIFRAEIQGETELGKTLKGYLDTGALVPDAITVKAVMGRLERDDCKAGWILDGFPRTRGQAEALDAALAARGETLAGVVYLTLDPEGIVQRMAGRRSCPTCGRVYHVEHLPPKTPGRCDDDGAALVVREDDKPETVRNRLATYERETAPLIGYYDDKGLLLRVDGDGTPEEVQQRLRAKLDTLETA